MVTPAIAVTVTAVNEAPAFSGLGGSVSHTEGGSATVLAGAATLSDPELSAANSFDGATLTLARSGGANADDIFSATGRLAALTAGQGLVLDGVVMGSITANAAPQHIAVQALGVVVMLMLLLQALREGLDTH